MPTLDSLLILSGASLAAIAMLALLFAWSWRAWLELKRRELEHEPGGRASGIGDRIELADLRARVKKLEAIAAGVDL